MLRTADGGDEGAERMRGVAENRTYNTVSIAVPIWILQGAIADAMTIDWKAAA